MSIFVFNMLIMNMWKKLMYTPQNMNPVRIRQTTLPKERKHLSMPAHMSYTACALAGQHQRRVTIGSFSQDRQHQPRNGCLRKEKSANNKRHPQGHICREPPELVVSCAHCSCSICRGLHASIANCKNRSVIVGLEIPRSPFACTLR